MKILFDGRYIGASDQEVLPFGGIGRYSYNLLKHLAILDPTLDLTILVPEENKRAILTESSCRVREVPCGLPASSLRTQFLLSKRVDSRPYDIFHSPFNMLPRGLHCRTAVTIHDIMWLTRPKLCARFLPERLAAGLLYRLGIRHALANADRVFAVSESAGASIAGYLPRCVGRLEVVHHGLEPFFHAIPGEDAHRQLASLFQPPDRFILMVGQGSPYKNQFRAVQAFVRAFADRPETRLILVRRFARFDREMRKLLDQPSIRRRVILLPSVTEDQLRALYTLADIFLFPSLEEGFGMPVLEAMACGTPVVAADIPVMREIAGNAALFVDPLDISSIGEGLCRLTADDTLRWELQASGHERIRRYSWRRCAERTLTAYRKTLAA